MKKLYNLAHYFRKLYWRTFNIKTFGARVMLIKEDKIFLLKHRYGNLWVMPGGGVKKGESFAEVAKREVYEETGFRVDSFERELGVYKNNKEGKDDTIHIFVSKNFRKGSPHNLFEKIMKKVEIREERWFPLNNLPENASKATKNRVKEYLENTGEFYEREW